MHENLGICKGPGKLLGEIRVGSDSINISKNGRYFYVLLNSRTVMAAKSQKELCERSVPVISLMIKSLCKTAHLDRAQWQNLNKDYTKMIIETIKEIKENLKPVEILVQKAKPDETQDNTSISIQSSVKKGMVEKLKDYRIALNSIASTINGLKKTSNILLKTDLEKKIWGSKEVMDVISGVKSEMEVLSHDYEKIEGCLEHSDGQADKIMTIIEKKYSTDYVKKIAGEIIENFSVLKSFSSELAQILHRLSSIDRVFTASVGYPATWFFNGSTYMDFLFEYDNLVDHVVKFATLESEVVEPLLVWKIKLS